ncbi:MAG: hypothetical protein IPO73_06415 [Gemmatimonadetes bacterium]|nr:hypothetical protein [Gemmatimonadota bacterium]
MNRLAPRLRRLATLLPLLTLVPARLAGQDSTAAGPCVADTTSASRICQAGVDALTAFLPIEGLLVSGGNPVPGTAAGIGKFGHARIAGGWASHG